VQMKHTFVSSFGDKHADLNVPYLNAAVDK
jgi:hypothetical protein